MAPQSLLRAALAVLQLVGVFATSVSGQSVAARRSPWADTVTGFAPDVSLADDWNASYPQYEGFSSPWPAVHNSRAARSADGNDTELEDTSSALPRRAAKDFYLRVMPLGASITQGVHSSDNNGYRKWIREQLRWQGWKVNMVGSVQTGTMKDRDHEGHPGWVITETGQYNGVQQAWDAAKWMKPNLVLLNVGTNDCSNNIDLDHAGDRMEALVTDIFNSVPGVVVIMSTLLPSPGVKDCAARVSAQYRAVAKKLQNGRLALADFNAAMSGDASMFSDDPIHPSDAGYKFMASVWWDAIAKVQDAITAPLDNGKDDDAGASATCAKVAGVSRGPVLTQQGSGHDDGGYVHRSQPRGVLPSLRFGKPADKSEASQIPGLIWFAQLTNPGNVDREKALDDWNEYWFRENLGNGNFADSVALDVGLNCDDGEADFWCIGSKTISVSINKRTRPPTFTSIGVVVPDIAPFKASDVRIADIDGDGRADLCFVHDNGDIGCSRNGGVGTNHYWQGFSTADGLRGIVFTGKQKGNKNGVRLADLNGDFRADWMWIGDEGDVDTYINQRGTGAGIVPQWTAAGITHAGLNTPNTGDRIVFGRIYGSNRLDYAHLKEADDHYDIEVWENLGAGGTKLKADGVFYCDMTGSGSDDYVWIYMDGHADAADFFANIHSPPDWGHSITISLRVPGPRMGIHLADWDGDGRCDVLVQDKATGALTMWHNDYDAKAKKLQFSNQGVKSGAARCTEGWGVGIFDRGLRLADIDGDGRADYLCIQPDGTVTAWLNRAGGMTDAGQVKATEGFDRANLRFADVEASGRADLIHLDKYTGAATVFKNDGYRPGDRDKNRGSSFHWTNRGVLYAPIDRGENMHFVNFGGLGRADLHHTWPDTNKVGRPPMAVTERVPLAQTEGKRRGEGKQKWKLNTADRQAETFFNECGGAGGDDGPVGESVQYPPPPPPPPPPQSVPRL
ncbi:carbohydrate esterase family 3 protein [Thermothielavioides terrestris NRRL 8126]|uniref:Carbohydrate esterase family 3 protein n=1 Tax=Thermothielavioides terrestris (strain ATCC 38088 / NRRL 8126) TaxID=578455 RepID=G2RFN2_THETT|nr:carbohydrate esterase family 3 protein [Thermothielavioides terrestris NRRL 8126]AEO70515.1 carbohydrate esterase family 3 protein [Thermothielavioides terrestris NRRL 8126]